MKKHDKQSNGIKRFRHAETLKVKFYGEYIQYAALFKELANFNKIKHVFIDAICTNNDQIVEQLSPLCQVVARNCHQIRTLYISYRCRQLCETSGVRVYPILFGIIDSNNKNPLLQIPQMKNKQITYPNLHKFFLRLWKIPLSQTLTMNQGCLHHLDFCEAHLTLECWQQACKNTDQMFNNLRSLTLHRLEKHQKYNKNEGDIQKYKIFPLFGKKLLQLESLHIDLYDTDLYLHLLYQISNAQAELQSKRLRNLKLDFGYRGSIDMDSDKLISSHDLNNLHFDFNCQFLDLNVSVLNSNDAIHPLNVIHKIINYTDMDYTCTSSKSCHQQHKLTKIECLLMNQCGNTFTQHFLKTSVNVCKIQFLNLKYLESECNNDIESIETLVHFIHHVHDVQRKKSHLLMKLKLQRAVELVTDEIKWNRFSNIIKQLYLNGLIILEMNWKRLNPSKSSKDDMEKERLHVDKIKSFCHDIKSAISQPKYKQALTSRLCNNSMCVNDRIAVYAYITKVDHYYTHDEYHYWNIVVENAVCISRYRFRPLSLDW